jgi:hypothetical protein
MSNNTSSSSGIKFTGLLTIVFITLKLCHVINWSWLWVLSPIWINAAFLLSIIIFVVLVAYLTRPKTPEERARAAIEAYAKRIRMG